MGGLGSPWRLALMGIDAIGNTIDRIGSKQHWQGGVEELDRWRDENRTSSPFSREGDRIRGAYQPLVNRRYARGEQTLSMLRSGMGQTSDKANQLRTSQMAGVEGRENQRVEQLETQLGGIQQQNDAVFARGKELVEAGLVSTKAHVASALDSARTGLQEATARADAQTGEVRGIFDKAIEQQHDSSIAHFSEAAGSIESSLQNSMTQIDAETGPDVPSQVKAQMKNAARMQHRDLGIKGAQQVRALHDTNMVHLQTAKAGTMGNFFTGVNAMLTTLRQDITGTERWAAELNPEQSAAKALTEISDSWSHKSMQSAQMLDMARQVRSNMITQTDMATGNNVLTTMAADRDWMGRVADFEDGLAAGALQDSMSIENMVSALNLQSIGTDLQLTREIAGAHFGWQNTVIPMGQVTGTLFDDMMQMMQLTMAMDANQAARDAQSMGLWGQLGGSALSTGGMVTGATILA